MKKIIFIFFLSFGLIKAQSPIYKGYSLKDGLPSYETYKVISGSKGFIWICSDAGISRFDGYNFKNFSTKDGLPENNVLKIYEDPKGRIWFTTISSYVGYIDNENIFNINYIFKENLSRPHYSFVSSIYVDEADTLWLGVDFKGLLFKVPPPYTDTAAISVELKKDFVLQFKKSYSFIYGTYGDLTPDTLYFLHGNKINNTLQFVSYNYALENLGKKVFYQYNDSILFFAIGKKLYRIKNNALLIYKELPKEICSLNKDKNGALWAGLFSGGVYHFKDPLKNNISDLFFDEFTVTSMTCDFENGYWFSTLEKGILYTPYLDLSQIGQEIKDAKKEISSIALLNSGKLAAQTYYGSLYIIDNKTAHKIENDGALILRSTYDDNKLFYCSANSSGFADLQNLSFLNFKIEKNINLSSKDLLELENGQLYGISAYSVFLITNNKRKKVLFSIKERINSCTIDKKRKRFWLLTKSGLYSYTEKDSLVYWGRKIPALSKSLDKITIDNAGNLWIAKRGGGLLVFDQKNIVKVINENNGQYAGFYKVIYPDSFSNIWVGTKEGLAKIDANNFKITNYYHLSKFISNEINDIKRSGNSLFLATSTGIYTLNITSIEKKAQQFRIPIMIRKVSSNISSNISNGSALKYNEKFITFHFLGLSYLNTGKILYKYKLAGLDSVWRYTSNLSVDYLNLPAGEYKFLVSVMPVNNKKNEVATFNLSVLPPYWKTNWFTFSTACVALMFLYGFYRIRALQIKKETQERMNGELFLARMESRSLRSQMNPHFIFNAVNSIQNFILKSDKKMANSYLTKFARLIRNILEYSQTDFILLSNEIETLELYLQLEKMRSADKFIYEINIDNELLITAIYVPSMLIQPIVENAIIHGLMPLDKNGGSIKISFTKKNSQIICVIKDNGIGRQKSKELKSANRIQHKPLGISITIERLEILKKIYNIDTLFFTEDLYDHMDKPCGTRVELIFPFKHEV